MMKKLKLFLITFLLLFVLAFSACGSEEKKEDTLAMQEEDNGDTLDHEEIEEAFDDELVPLEGDELAMMEDTEGDAFSEDDEMMPLDESEMEGDPEEIMDLPSDEEDQEDEDPTASSGGVSVKEDGSYTGKDEVAVYLHTYGKLPSNFITKKEAKELGWVSSEGNLEEVAPGKSIGGDKFGNYDKMLPEEDGRTFWECDIDYDGGFRNSKRIVYSNDGLIFYTEDHYVTFEQIY